MLQRLAYQNLTKKIGDTVAAPYKTARDFGETKTASSLVQLSSMAGAILPVKYFAENVVSTESPAMFVASFAATVGVGALGGILSYALGMSGVLVHKMFPKDKYARLESRIESEV
ncbi:hypothetical protein HOF78_04080 [Candidatus Woesearchaeota archaeon]|jgi:hypothetical protein|nr:hypothetical protein [Candidatus Woesearchaeota archaeon]MBT6023472.1 hypothetical protein [Candidatus Woesearchaeota archaeon]MBT6044460.1 hypothetical protein [Candidatus Woesearchaeota archaeon]